LSWPATIPKAWAGHSTRRASPCEPGIAVRAGHHCAQPILRRFGVEATVRHTELFLHTLSCMKEAQRNNSLLGHLNSFVQYVCGILYHAAIHSVAWMRIYIGNERFLDDDNGLGRCDDNHDGR
jgi:hypothetical protein